MSDISQVTVGGTTYDIKDATARTDKDKVAQYNANVATDNSYYPVVFSYSTSSSDVTTYLKKTNSIYYNPYAKDLRVSGINSTTGKSHATSVYYDRLRVYDQYFEDPMDVSSLVEECIEISPTDITFTEGDTWDGTNSSLKTAVTALKSNLTEYVTLKTRATVSSKNTYIDYTLDDNYTKYKKIVFVIDGNGIYYPMEIYSFLIITAETRTSFWYNGTMLGTLNIKRVNDTKLSISFGNQDTVTYAMAIYGVTV